MRELAGKAAAVAGGGKDFLTCLLANQAVSELQELCRCYYLLTAAPLFIKQLLARAITYLCTFGAVESFLWPGNACWNCT